MYENFEKIDSSDIILIFRNVLGNGLVEDVYDIIYVKMDIFNVVKNLMIVCEIE
jgi:hypothetical protein